jgi:hypothetical protein
MRQMSLFGAPNCCGVMALKLRSGKLPLAASPKGVKIIEL